MVIRWHLFRRRPDGLANRGRGRTREWSNGRSLNLDLMRGESASDTILRGGVIHLRQSSKIYSLEGLMKIFRLYNGLA